MTSKSGSELGGSSASVPVGRPLPVGSDPKTVINPERRHSPQPLADSSVTTGSAIWNRLFPPEVELGQPVAVDAPVGIELGHFVIEERIGMGGMGAVFRALDVPLQRIVALKVLSPAQSRDSSAVERFKNEAKAAARLDHDNIARVYYVGEDKGLHFIAFEFVTGTNVRDLIRERGQLEPEDAINYTLQIASALKHTSACGLVHRDIKPSNIIISPTGRANLVDLGLARKASTESAADLTVAGTTLGTFDYISPEQAKDPRNVDVRSDIYSLGCTLYHMLAGEAPYPHGTVLQKLLDHQGKEPPDPAKKNRRVSEDLSAIVRKMMASDPRRRYAEPDQLINDLLLVAGAMGLRGINPEGLVWMSSKPPAARFWERNIGWMATTALLLVIVFIFQMNPRIGVPFTANNSPSMGTSTFGSDPNVPQGDASSASTGTTVDTLENGDSSGGFAEGAPLDPAEFAATNPNTNSNENSLSPVVDAGIADGAASGNLTVADGPGSQDVPTVAESISSQSEQIDVDQIFRNPLPTELRDLDPENHIGSLIDGMESSTQVASSTVDTTPGSAETNVFTPIPSPPVTLQQELKPFTVRSVDGTEKNYRTLEAACTEAADGSVVLLAFDGVRSNVEPLRIVKKSITIRAATGYAPTIEFVPAHTEAEGFQTRMVIIDRGGLDVHNVNFNLSVGLDFNTDQLTLFSLQHAEKVRLNNVVVTVENPSNATAAIVDIVPEPGALTADITLIDSVLPRAPLNLEVTGAVLRGECNLIAMADGESSSIVVKDSTATITGSILNVVGGRVAPSADARLDLTLEHVTCIVGGSLVHMDSGSDEIPRELIPVKVQAFYNIFSSFFASPLIRMTGSTDDTDFRRLLTWNGDKNFFDRYTTFWAFPSGQNTLDFNDWTLEWEAEPQSRSVGSNNDGIDWSEPWYEKPLSELVPSDLALDVGEMNPAAMLTADGSNVGAKLDKLPLAIE